VSGETFSLRFRILEPMMFRRAGEFDPSSRGIYSSARSFILPTPSTIAGAVATLILEQNPGLMPGGESWEEEIKSVLGNAELRGPYLLKSGDFQVAYGERGLRLGELPGLAVGYWRLAQTEAKTYSEAKEWVLLHRELIKELERKAQALGKLQERVGVGLLKRAEGVKVADEKRGLLYAASYVDYVLSAADTEGVEICVDARNLQLEDSFYAVKLGGEGRVTALRKGSAVLTTIKSVVWRGREKAEGSVALYLASPALFKCGLTREKLLEVIAEKLSTYSARVLGIVGSTALLGAGFSLSKGRRKPVYLALEPGSIIFVDLPDPRPLEQLYWSSLSEAGGQLGYGTAIPIPLTMQ